MYLYFALSGLLNGLASTLLGLLVFFKNRRNTVNRTFALFCFFASIWAYAYIFWPLADNRESALLWFRLLHIGAIFVSITYLHFITNWLGLFQQNKRIIIFGYVSSFLFLLFIFSPLFIKDAVPKFGMKYWAEPGILYHFYLFLFFLYAIYSSYLLFINYKKLTNIKRTQVKYLLVGMVVSYLGASTNYPLWYNINIPPFGNILAMAYVVFSAYAILKYRFMDIRMIFSKSAVYILSLATVVVLALTMIRVGEILFLPVRGNIVYIVILTICVLVFQAIFRFYEKIASKYFYYTFYSYQRVISDLGTKLTEILELHKLCSLIINTLVNTMKLDKTGVLLRDSNTGKYQIQKIIGFREENGISLVKDNFLTNYLEHTRKPLVYGELSLFIRDIEDERSRQQLEKLKFNMEKIEANLCLPLFREDKITGMIILGSKISGEPYSEQDIDLLTTLSSQASIALENAKLYAQVQDLSQNLQRKVDAQTKKIKKAYEVEKSAHAELQRLDQAKTQFIMATQHHLRTPLTSMAGYLDLIFGGTFGKTSVSLNKTLKKFQVSVNRLVQVVNELLDISQFQLGKEVVDLRSGVEIGPILKEIIEELKPETETKKTYLKLVKPKKTLPFIKADSEKLKVAITNIVDNGVKYTEKGGVTIQLRCQNSIGGSKGVDKLKPKLKLQIIVSDTGMGIPESELGKLFSRTFERSEKAKQVYTTGRGIGLYITSQIIQAHNGRIWAESKGKNKGSSFYIELPVD
jgi:signal transduction histidine kinase